MVSYILKEINHCGGNSLSETDGNKKAKKSQQTNKKFVSLPSMFFCNCYLIQGICNIFISTGGCSPHFALFHAMKHFSLWGNENVQNYSKNLIQSKYITL